MSEPTDRPKIYHITHVDNLSAILTAGGLESDARRLAQETGYATIGMTEIKQRRLTLEVDCHPGTNVGEYVPFYFCPRSFSSTSATTCLLTKSPWRKGLNDNDKNHQR